MTPKEIFENFNNAWSGLCQQYDNCRNEEIRCAINLLSKIIRKIESEYGRSKEKQEEHQISIDEWVKWFQKWRDEE